MLFEYENPRVEITIRFVQEMCLQSSETENLLNPENILKDFSLVFFKFQ